jgi:hypothetical protein
MKYPCFPVKGKAIASPRLDPGKKSAAPEGVESSLPEEKILVLPSLYPPGAKKISAKCSTAMVSWGANCSSPRLLNITCGDLLPSPLPLSPTGRGKGEGDLWRYFLQRLGL